MRIKRHYKFARTKLISVLGVSDVQDITWDGGNFEFHHTPATTNNNPIAGIDKIEDKSTLINWADIKSQFFASIPDSKFENMGVIIDATNVTVFLNLEE